MIASALFYYQFQSIRNGLRARIRRLQQPKYLFGAVVGGLYFYWYIFGAWRHQRPPAPSSAEALQTFQLFAAFGLLVAILAVWILPQSRAALAFTEAEVAFLFPAPISRRTLLHFKILKMLLGILVSMIFVSLIGRQAVSGSFLIHLIGWWVVFGTLSLHALCCSFARTMLLDRGISNWQRRLGVLCVVGGVVAAVVIWARKSMPPLTFYDGDVVAYLSALSVTGPMPYILWPFQIIIAPFFAPDLKALLPALIPALAVMGLHYWWIIHSDVAFEEASLELSRKTAERIAAIRSGNWQSARKPKKSARSPFKLKAAGFPLVALLWKNLLSAGQIVTTRFWMILLWCVFFGGTSLRSAGSHSDIILLICMLAMFLLFISLFWAPQILRNDLRQVLLTTDVLKMYPMPGWQVVLGEVLAPVAMLAGAQWLLIALVLVMLPGHAPHEHLSIPEYVLFALSAAVVLPMIDFIALLIPNACVLFLPAWFHLGKDGPAGIEAMGQRLILMIGQLLILIVTLLPAGVVFAAIFWMPSIVIGAAPAALMASIAAALVLAIEAGLYVVFLGGVFERFDLSKELG